MKKIVTLCYAVLASLAFVACSEDTYSLSENLQVSSFYPTVVMDGTDVKIVGSNLANVTEVEFPGGVKATNIKVESNQAIVVTAPSGVSTAEGSLIVRAGDDEVASRQFIHKAEPKFNDYSFTSDDGAATNNEMSILGRDLLLVDQIQFTNGTDVVNVPAILMTRKTNDAIKFVLPSDAPIGEGIGVNLIFKNGSIMPLPALNIVRGVTEGYWVEKEVFFDESATDVGSWAHWIQIDGSKFSSAKVGDKIRVYVSDCTSNPQGALRGSDWNELDEGLNYFNITDEDIANGYYEYTLTEAGQENLLKGLIIGGQNYVAVKSALVTMEWVQGAAPVDLRDPITENTIMLNSYEQNGDHNANWDLSWGVKENTVVETDEDGNTFIHLIGAIEGWILNCNHVDCGTVSGIENYNIKVDVRVDEGTDASVASGIQWVIGDNWCWVGGGLFPANTDGKWITISMDCAALGLSGDLEIGKKTNGLFGNFPGGICFDNLRLDPK